MTAERKPAGQSWESFAESRLREAMDGGAFRNLPGLGQPIPDIDEPWDENSWVRKKLRSERITALPPILEARLRREQFLERLDEIPTEAEVRRQGEAVNQFIREAHYSHLPGPREGVRPIDLDAALAQWRQTRQA